MTGRMSAAALKEVRIAGAAPTTRSTRVPVRPVIIEKSHFSDSGNDHTTFAGIYDVAAFPDLLPRTNAKLDTHLLLLNQGVIPDERL